jgi:predicted nucleotidyltransferase
MTAQDEIKKLSLFFSNQKDKPLVTLAYMFGSRADRSAGQLSDYDIAVLYSEAPPDTIRYRLSHVLAKNLNTDRIDLVVLNRAPIELKYAVIASGILVYEKSPAERVEFESHSLSLYGDYLPILRRQSKEILEERKYEAGIQRYRTALGQTQRLLAKIRTV